MNRKLAYIVKDQKPLVLAHGAACLPVHEGASRRFGAVA